MSAKKRMLTAILCALLLAGCMTACSDNGSSSTTSNDTTVAEQNGNEVTDETTAEPEVNYLEKLGEMNLDGRTVTVIAHHGTNNRENLPEEKENGEPVNDALYKRNLDLTTRYNFEFENIATDDGSKTLSLTSTAILAGEAAYDFIFADMVNTAKGLALIGSLYDFSTDVPHVDLSREWWSKHNESDLSLGGKILFPTGVITPMHFKTPYAMLFNKRLAEAYNVGNLYELVDNGTWTVDTLASFMVDTSKDLNGDGTMNLDDQYSLVYDEVAGYGFFIGAGRKMTAFDDEGMPYLTMNSADTVNTVERLRSIVGDKSVALRGEDYIKNAEFDVFAEGRALFAGQTLVRVQLYRDMEDDFGMLPMPKLDEAQEDYYCYAQPWSGTSVCIPITNDDVDSTGRIIEAMAYLSNDYIRTASYEVNFKSKFARDKDSERMLDIVTDTASYDLNVIFNWDRSAEVLRDNVLGNLENYVSAIEAKMPAAAAEIETLKETLASHG